MARIVTRQTIAGRRVRTVRTAAPAAKPGLGRFGRMALMALTALLLLTAGNLARGALEGGVDEPRLAAWDPALHNAAAPAASARIVPALRGAHD